MLNEIGSYICHQLPSHSLFINGNQLFVCARDTGIYLGILFCLGMIYALKEYRRGEVNLGVLLVLVLPMAIDGTSQLVGLWEGTNGLRVATGLLAGIGIGYLLVTPMLGRKEGKYPSSKGLLAGMGFSVLAYICLMKIVPVYLDVKAAFLAVNYLAFAGFLSGVSVLAYSAYKLADSIYRRIG